jgi:hypothetical protein
LIEPFLNIRVPYVNTDDTSFALSAFHLFLWLSQQRRGMADTDREHADAVPEAENGKTAPDTTSNGNVDFDEPKPPKPSLLKKIQTKLGLDVPTVLLMLK